MVNSEDHHPGIEWMLLEMGRSVFCLTPNGAGWGSRLKLAVMFGCIPVVINQNVQASQVCKVHRSQFRTKGVQRVAMQLASVACQQGSSARFAELKFTGK